MKPILTAYATFPGLLASCLGATMAFGQEPPKPLLLELNAVTATQDACQLTLVVTNGLGMGLTRAAWQVAVFDNAGAVKTLPVLDFGALPPGKTRVAQFALPGQRCDDLGRVVVNDVAQCQGDDGSDQRAACLTGLATRNLSDIEFGL